MPESDGGDQQLTEVKAESQPETQTTQQTNGAKAEVAGETAKVPHEDVRKSQRYAQGTYLCPQSRLRDRGTGGDSRGVETGQGRDCRRHCKCLQSCEHDQRQRAFLFCKGSRY